MYSAAENDEDLVEFDVAELISLEQRRKYKELPFSVLFNFLKDYMNFIEKSIKENKKENITRFVLPIGKNPIKHLYVPFVEERSIIGGRGIVGLIGYLQTSRYPLTFDFIQWNISPIPIPRTRAILNPAHFIIFEHENKAYIIFERNSSAPSLTKFTEYVCNAWNILDQNNSTKLCPIKHKYIMKDPESTLRHYRIVTGITISGGLKAAVALESFKGTSIIDSILRLNARHFTIEFSGRGNMINLTIDDVIDIYRRLMEKGGRNIVSKFTVKVKRRLSDKSMVINLLGNLLVMYRHVPWARDEEGRELGSLDTNEAFKALVELASEAKRLLSGVDQLPTPSKKSKTILDYLVTE